MHQCVFDDLLSTNYNTTAADRLSYNDGHKDIKNQVYPYVYNSKERKED